MTAYYAIDGRTYALMHEGKKGMHWGERYYQYEDGSLTPLGYIHYGYTKRMRPAVDRAVDNLRSAAKAAGKSTKNYVKDLDRAKGEGYAAQPTTASRAHTAKAEAQARALHAKLAKARGDAKKLQKVAMKEAIKNARKRAKEDARIYEKDKKWLARNGEKLIKQARKNKAIQKELKAYEKELSERLRIRKGDWSPKLNNALNQREAQLLNKYVSVKSPNGTAVTFVAMRRDRGVLAAIGDASRFRNGVYADGTAAYTKDKARQV